MIYNAQKVPVFGVILVRISRIRTRITPNTDTFYAVIVGSVTALHVRDSQYKNPIVVTGICDQSKFRARHYKSKIDIFFIFNKTSLRAERKTP